MRLRQAWSLRTDLPSTSHPAIVREAEEIRAYVSAVRERQAALDEPLSATGFQQWADWALGQADRIDPVLSGSFRTVQDDD